MIIHAITFYTFATVILVSGFMVIAARNPVHSVLFLILAFFNGAGLFVLLGAEFLAMILVIVYVGAVAVLFLFVVMMLDIDFTQMREGFLHYLPVGALVGLVVLVELVLVVGQASVDLSAVVHAAHPTPDLSVRSNTAALGDFLYTDFVYFFQAAGLILLVAMIGAIVLTLRHRPGVRRQVIADQVGRKREEGVEIVSVKPGQGL